MSNERHIPTLFEVEQVLRQLRNIVINNPNNAYLEMYFELIDQCNIIIEERRFDDEEDI